jgi:hypothetical protein
MTSSDIFDLKPIRWNIYSFINEPSEYKIKFSHTLQQLKYKFIYDKEIIPRLLKGTRFTIKDEYGVCTNCYHYGPYPEAGSIKGRCMNHVYEDYGDIYWMTFKEFKKHSRSSFHYQTYEEYEFETRIKFRKMKDEQEREFKKAEIEMQEYYRNLYISAPRVMNWEDSSSEYNSDSS